MARGINKVILVGRAGDDPTVRYMPNGNAVASVTLATSDSYKDKATGQMVEKTEWHRISFFGKLAEIVGEYVRKGSQIYVEGKLQTRKWTDQQGQEKYTTEVVVDGFTGQMQMLGQRQQGQGNQAQGPQGGQHKGQVQGNNSYSNSNNNYQGNGQAQRQGNQGQQQDNSAPKQSNQQQRGVSNSQYMNGGQQQGGSGNPMGPGNDFYDDEIPFAPIGLQYPALLMCI